MADVQKVNVTAKIDSSGHLVVVADHGLRQICNDAGEVIREEPMREVWDIHPSQISAHRRDPAFDLMLQAAASEPGAQAELIALAAQK